jgi:hypothetical protein
MDCGNLTVPLLIHTQNQQRPGWDIREGIIGEKGEWIDRPFSFTPVQVSASSAEHRLKPGFKLNGGAAVTLEIRRASH